MHKITLIFLITTHTLLATQNATAEINADSSNPQVIMPVDYSYSYWLNGMRKNPDDKSAAILCFETGHYGFTLDIENFSHASFGHFSDELSYTEALEAGAKRLDELKQAELILELEINGEIYKAIGCLPALGTHATYPEVANPYDAGKDVQHLDARLWESGRLVQHYDLLRLKFENNQGQQLSTRARLDIVAWPDSLTLTVEVEPEYEFQDGPHNGVNGFGLCLMEKPWITVLPATMGSTPFTIETWVSIPQILEHPREGWLLSLNHGEKVGAGFKIKFGKATAYFHPNEDSKTGIEIQQLSYAHLPNQWNHLVLSYDGEKVHYYLNGTLQGSESVANDLRLKMSQLHLGVSSKSDSPVQGLYDQVRIWDRALTTKEITTHFNKPAEFISKNGLRLEENFDFPIDHLVDKPIWKDTQLSVRLKSGDQQWDASSERSRKLTLGAAKRVSLNLNIGAKKMPSDQLSIDFSSLSDGQKTPVTYRSEFSSYVAEVKKVARDWTHGYSEIRDYDEFIITVDNADDALTQVPLLLYLRDVANPTGLCPILCDTDGEPLGIPVQVSKNWHDASLGAYVRAYMRLPAKVGSTAYRLRIPYGFYGTLPSASHAMLSLVGYGGLGRWEQLSIGCWGESMCFDMDMSCVQNTVTDVRMLMTRHGKDGGKWNWTDAAWGGDWLGIFDAKGQKHFFSELKTAYLAHGPCLSDVRYNGSYGSRREADFTTKLSILRTDDHVRSFQNISYEFNEPLKVEGSWLFKVGGGIRSISPKIAYGNAEGLIKAEDVPSDLKQGDWYMNKVTLSGDGPWWVAFPGGYTKHDKKWGTGSRGIIIRDYQATFSGKTYHSPTISLYTLIAHLDGRKNIDLLFVPPTGVDSYQPGDRVKIDVEWVTVPRIADDYYGPNEAFRDHLTKHPSSWETVYREASGNDLKVDVKGGELINAYPILIKTESNQVRVNIQGGIGAVPICFEGLSSAKGYKLYNITSGNPIELDQSVHGNDFWQTDYDAQTETYRITFNLQLDGIEQSAWELRRQEIE